jgi:DNA-binding Lrp family transcriptional regulator
MGYEPIRYAAAYVLTFPIQDATGANVTGALITTKEVSKDSGAFANTTNALSEIGASGVYTLALTATEMTARMAKGVKQALARIKGASASMINLDGVTGPYDFIATVEGPTLDAIGRLVTDEIGIINGVTRTTTCVAVAIG